MGSSHIFRSAYTQKKCFLFSHKDGLNLLNVCEGRSINVSGSSDINSETLALRAPSVCSRCCKRLKMTLNADNLQQLHMPPWLHCEGIVKMWNGPLKMIPQTVPHAYCTQIKTITIQWIKKKTILQQSNLPVQCIKTVKSVRKRRFVLSWPRLTPLHSPFTHSLEFSGKAEQTDDQRGSQVDAVFGPPDEGWLVPN